MRIMVVAPGTKFSTYDTFRYYTEAFKELGHNVFTFNYHDHYGYHATALFELEGGDTEDIEFQRKAIVLSGEDLISRIARKKPDLVFVISALALPPGIWDWFDSFNESLKNPFTTMVLFTESPYIDETQLPILEMIDLAATMDMASLDMFRSVNENTIYIRHAYNPEVHRPMSLSPEHMADVFMVGTGFPERIKMLASIDWSGIDLRIFGGNWGDIEESDKLEDYYEIDFLDNEVEVPLYYSNSKINLNIFRTAKWPGENVTHISPDLAYSISPRCYEIMGCGGFLLTDARQELLELFEDGKDLVVFDGVEDLEDKIQYYLMNDRARRKIALSGLKAVSEHTYVNRARKIIKNVEDFWRVL
jgi:spore maturation protein CgeB